MPIILASCAYLDGESRGWEFCKAVSSSDTESLAMNFRISASNERLYMSLHLYFRGSLPPFGLTRFIFVNEDNFLPFISPLTEPKQLSAAVSQNQIHL